MGTKTFNNYEDFLTFTRASGGHALRPVSYGTELVDTANTASSWTAYGTNTVAQDGDAVKITYVDNSQGAFIYLDASGGLSSSFEQGKLYRLTAEAKINTGSASLAFYDGSATNVLPAVSSTTYIELSFNFVFSGSNRPYINTSGLGSGEIFHIKSVSVKEVSFDKSDGTLTLFEHPDNIPRVEWDAQRNRLGLLVEESRTNLWVFSEDMSQTSFGGTGGTATTDQYVAPDGTQTGDLVTMTSGQVYAYKSVTISTPTNVAYTISCYVKAAEANTSVGFRIGEFGGAAAGKFHDSDYTAISSTEWTRLDFTQTLEQSDRTQVQAVIRTTSATGSLLIWGVQLEQGSFPTSYIKTTSSTATRSSELADVLVDNFGYNNSNEGTFVIHAKNLSYNPNGTDYPFLVRFDNATNSNDRLGIFLSEASGNLVAEIKRNNVTQMSPVFKTATGGAVDEIVVAFAFAEDDFAVSDDGDAVITDTAGTLVPSSPIAKIGLGQAFNSVHMNAHITSFQYYPRRLTNAQIEDLSS